jgi:hypothetical protein
MYFLLKNPKFFLLLTLGLLVTEAIIGIVMFLIFTSLFGGLLSPPDPDPSALEPFYKKLAEFLFWGSFLIPIPFFFRVSQKKVGLKNTIKLFAIYSVLVFLFTVGQLVGMENAWVVIFLILIIVPVMYYLFVKY